MDFSASALDIEELVAAFAEMEGTELDQMKELWRSRNFSFIHEARPKDIIPSFYAQALFSSALSHVVAEDASLSWKLGGLYVLYILHETQALEERYKIYLALEELEALISLVRLIKQRRLAVAFKVVQRMFDEQMFLFGSVSANQKRIASCMDKVAHQAALSVQQARSRLLANVPAREHVEGQLVQDLELDALAPLTSDYAAARNRALRLAGDSNRPAGEDDANEVRDALREAQAWDVQKSGILTSAAESSSKRPLPTAFRRPPAPKQARRGRKTIEEYERELRQHREAHRTEGPDAEYEKELEEELDRALGLD
ncbi:snRNA-activating protein complex subunit 1 [Marchantia polymorpha subsp. ruderalis]